ncbi:MAG: hypothetical protein JWN27_865 [Candidatus Eremiobacteraeota bacterium]|nr:hypothetical protein [Candidatus Eremiobacteraeota bacterium]
MENHNGADRRRNVLDIVADLGFLERKQQSSVDAAAVATEPVAPPALALVPSVKHDTGPAVPAAPPSPSPAASTAPPDAAASPAASSASNAAHADVMQALTDAQRRAAEQRVAAERFLKETVQLEERLAEEAEQARAASEHVLAQQLARAADEALVLERHAAEQAEACAKKIERIATQKAQAEALRIDDHAAQQAAAAEVIAAQGRLAESRRRLEIATVACTESSQRYNDVCSVEEAARAEAEKAVRLAQEQRAEREKLEVELRAVQERAATFKGNLPSLASVEELRALEARSFAPSEAAKRVAERRAADAARRLGERHVADAERSAAS